MIFIFVKYFVAGNNAKSNDDAKTGNYSFLIILINTYKLILIFVKYYKYQNKVGMENQAKIRKLFHFQQFKPICIIINFR